MDSPSSIHKPPWTCNRLTQERLSRKQTELEHVQKRMATLASVRPPHMAEMEALQAQLQELFTQYASRFRNLQYMRLQLDARRDAEREAMAEADRHRRRLLRRLKKEELRILRGEGEVCSAAHHLQVAWKGSRAYNRVAAATTAAARRKAPQRGVRAPYRPQCRSLRLTCAGAAWRR